MKIRIEQADKVIDGQVVPVLVMTGPPDDVVKSPWIKDGDSWYIPEFSDHGLVVHILSIFPQAFEFVKRK